MRWFLLLLVASCLPQSEECRDYVACQKAYDDDVDTKPYEEGGLCWQNPQSASECTEQCKVALDALRDLDTPPEECR